MDAAQSLLSDHGVQAYFLILGIAIYHCIKVYYHHTPVNNRQKSSTSNSQPIKDDTLSTNKPSIIPLILSTLIILTTWYLIINFILTNIYTASYFDDAYKDVLRRSSNSSNSHGHYFTSTQLLTWAIVAVAWCGVEQCNVCFILFGFLGAMSASFVLWVPTLYRQGRISNVVGNVRRRSKERNKERKKQSSSIPITYIITSIIAFICILNLQPCNPTPHQECTPDEGFGTFHINFRYWLQLLHVILVVPIFIPYLLPNIVYNRLPSIHSCTLFGLLFVTFSYWHLYQLTTNSNGNMSNDDGQQCSDKESNISRGARYTMPITDCQLSITTDLVCCSFITLYAIYKDYSTASGRRGRDGSSHGSSKGVAFTRMCIGVILMPIISPAGVLAGHLCLLRLNDYHTGLVASLQRLVASKLSGVNDVKWCNLGLWTTTPATFDNDNEPDTCEYYEACENLAKALGKAAELDSNDAVLSCGCGSSLNEVQYYKRQFNLRHITGIDAHLDEGRMTGADDYNARAIRAGVEDLAVVDDNEDMSLFPPRLFNKIIALDNIYHYSSKESFLKDCYAMLPSGGKVAVSDVVLKNDSDVTPLWVKVVLRLMGIPTCNLWSVDQYKSKLASIGYGDDIKLQLVGEHVFKGWQRFLPQCLLKHLDYALIVATKMPGSNANIQPTKRKSVAIIGSGLAGLSSAYSLLSSSEAANFDIDIYEANDCPGLAGNTTLVGGQLVDVPARMACLGYYDHYCQLLDELDIPSTVVRTDSSFYGDDGHGNQVCYSYGQSSLANIYSALVRGGIGKLWSMIKALGNLQCDDGDNENITFGDWLHINLGVSKETSYTCKHTGVEKQHDLPSLTCNTNPFAYVMCGSLSWMLSCTWDDLLNYPADIVLPYCSGLKMDKLGVGREGQVIRIVPSIKCLERTLLYGVRQLYLNQRISAIDNKRMINGISYDAVIVATEAKAVPKVIKHCSPVFEKITYHPSCIYIHTDESFMPPNKKDWNCWNVEMSSGRQEPQLTFWLNEFYPDATFDKNVFQTWAPITTPKEGTIIRHSQFERVVHSNDARSYIIDINKEQGKNGIYYAGSYCVYGMGLLEQALISGKEVSNLVLVLNDMKCSSVLKEDTLPPLKALVIGAGPSGLVTAKHPWVHALRLRWWLSTIFIRLFLFLTGSSWGFNQWTAPTKPVKRGYHIINKSHAAMSHMNVPIKSQSLYGRMWMWIYGETDLKPIQTFHQTQVASVDDDGITVKFDDGRTYEADLIVLATGYKQSFPFLDDKIRHDIQEESFTDDSSYYLEEDYLPSEHFIVSKAHPRLGFIGFVRPNVGAIPPMSELQVMWWLEHIKGRTKKLTKRTGSPSYMVLGQKYRYGVDYGNYMHRVAEEIDAAPTLTTLAKSRHPIKALYTYCIGQSMISLFRLQGPYESELCWEVVIGELWRVCLKRGVLENCGLLFMTFLSLLMNITACVLECIWCIITFRKPKLFVRY